MGLKLGTRIPKPRVVVHPRLSRSSQQLHQSVRKQRDMRTFAEQNQGLLTMIAPTATTARHCARKSSRSFLTSDLQDKLKTRVRLLDQSRKASLVEREKVQPHFDAHEPQLSCSKMFQVLDQHCSLDRWGDSLRVKN